MALMRFTDVCICGSKSNRCMHAQVCCGAEKREHRNTETPWRPNKKRHNAQTEHTTQSNAHKGEDIFVRSVHCAMHTAYTVICI